MGRVRRIFGLFLPASGLALVFSAAIAPATWAGGSPPHLDRNTPLTVSEGGTAPIDNTVLITVDAESPATQITYTINPDGGGSPPVQGTLKLSGSPLGSGSTFTQDDVDNGRVTYTHDGSESPPTDEFQFGVKDGDGLPASDNGFVVFTFHINVTPVDDPPIALDHTYSIGIGASLSDYLHADDPDSPGITYSLVTNGAAGVVTLLDASTGAFSYAPSPNQTGSDQFTFTANDGNSDSPAPGTITINIEEQPPTAHDDSVATLEGYPVDGTLTATDPDLPPEGLIYSIAGNGSGGTAQVLDPIAGTFRYTPNANAIGEDSFTFQAYDGTLTSAPGVIRVKIRPRLDVGDLLVSDGRGHQVVLIDPSTSQAVVLSSGGGLGEPRCLDVGRNNMVDVISPGNGVIRVKPFDGSQTVVSPGSNFTTSPLGAFGLAIEGDGNILVGDGVNGVVRVDPVTGATNTVSAGNNLNLVLGVAVAPNGDIYATDASVFIGGDSKLVRIDPVSGAQTVVSSGGGIVLPAGVAISGNTLLVLSASTAAGLPEDQLLRIDPDTGDQTVLSSGGLMQTPTGLAVRPNGDIVLANQNAGNILRVDPLTGAQSVLYSGAPLQKPFAIHSINAPAAVDGVRPNAGVERLELSSCAPTPAVTRGRIDYALPREAHVRLRIYDISGRLVRTLVDRVQAPGRSSVVLDASGMASGVYFLRLEAARSSLTRRLVIAH